MGDTERTDLNTLNEAANDQLSCFGLDANELAGRFNEAMKKTSGENSPSSD